VSQDSSHINRKPKTSVTTAKMIMATSNWVSVRFCNDSAKTAARRVARTGTPEPSSYTVMVRPMMP
jgi:hypothetical protein